MIFPSVLLVAGLAVCRGAIVTTHHDHVTGVRTQRRVADLSQYLTYSDGKYTFEFCDIGNSMTSQMTSGNTFSLDILTAPLVGSILSLGVKLKACFKIEIDMCLETAALTFQTTEPIEVDLSTINGYNLASNFVKINIPEAGKVFDLPKIQDPFAGVVVPESYCEEWTLDPFPDNLRLCAKISNFTLTPYAFKMCPSVELYIGSNLVYTLTYQSLNDAISTVTGTSVCVGNDPNCECLEFSYLAECRLTTATGRNVTIPPSLVELFRSFDSDNTMRFNLSEFTANLMNLGMSLSGSDAASQFNSMDSDSNAFVSVDEFQSFAVSARSSDASISCGSSGYTEREFAGYSVAIGFCCFLIGLGAMWAYQYFIRSKRLSQIAL